jgi:hypothetical protein
MASLKKDGFPRANFANILKSSSGEEQGVISVERNLLAAVVVWRRHLGARSRSLLVWATITSAGTEKEQGNFGPSAMVCGSGTNTAQPLLALA